MIEEDHINGDTSKIDVLAFLSPNLRSKGVCDET